MGKRLYAYASPRAMIGHRFADDVAICLAKSRKKAMRKFVRLYGTADRSNVSRVRLDSHGVAILTDY